MSLDASGGVVELQSQASVVLGRQVAGNDFGRKCGPLGGSMVLKDRLLSELTKYCGKLADSD